MSFMLLVKTAFGSYTVGQRISNMAEMQSVLSGPNAANVSVLRDTDEMVTIASTASAATNAITLDPS